MPKSNGKTLVVLGKDGLRGTIAVDKSTKRTKTKSEQRLLTLDSGKEILIPFDTLIAQDDGSYYLPLSLTEIEGTDRRVERREEVVVPIVAEQLEITKNEVITGRVRINKIVREHEETVDEPLLREQVTVERVPINRMVDEPIPVRHEGDTMIIPILEEVLVVQKRLMLKEELHITTRRTTANDPQTIMLRTEEVEIERLAPDSTT